MRHFCYVTGTRAEFGLMKSTLKQIDACHDLDVSLCVTGMHLLPQIGKIGQTVEEIKVSGLKIAAAIETPSLLSRSGEGMILGIAEQIPEMVNLFKQSNFDAVIVLGDRGEMLAATLAAAHLNIPVIHIHGGERSGTIDESIRHAISKIAHYHFVATKESQERLIKMGEKEEHIFVVGAPGLDDTLGLLKLRSKDELCRELDFDPSQKVCLALYHPVLQEEKAASDHCVEILHALEEMDLQTLFLHPNTDAGSSNILTILNAVKSKKVRIVEHLERANYLSWLAASDFIIGNSSSAIIEAASFRTPAVDVGNRQKAREASENVIRVANGKEKIMEGIENALNLGKKTFHNIYGDGKAGERIIASLRRISLTPEILKKLNQY